MNFIQKYKLYKKYKKTIKDHKIELKNQFNIEIDWINRLYTTVDFPPEKLEEIQKYGYKFTDGEVAKKIKDIDSYLKEIGLIEFYKIDNIEQINPLTIGIVFKFALLDSKKLFFNKLFLILGLSILTIITIVIFI